ncbi:Major facilitator superfamily domain, general substrate transporter [Penicillium expansum]|nr:Major facilitator superfamily domain, general substrate transporter [Penicillium expansum]KGO70248.1 Major facilitator superfamily domain, general substrate transporter [Penicillium expansum]
MTDPKRQEDTELASADDSNQYESGGITSTPVDQNEELIDTREIDLALTRKMALANAAINEVGMTPFHWKLFFLNGFGYGADTFGNPSKHITGISMASQVGLLVGAAVWGLSAGIVGRRLAFNSSFFICAVFVLIAGAMPNYVSFAAMVAIYSAADGGNYILDTTNLIEFLPVSHLWLTTFLALWWAVSYTITGLLAWAFLGNYTCHSDATICTNRENMGWRYLHFTCGGLITVLAILRIFMIHMPQTPKWLITQNRDAEVFDILKNIVDSYKRPFSLTLQQLEEPGHVLNAEKSVWSSVRLQKHFSGLFATHRLAYSTYVINLNWFLVGIVSPLYTIYLPYYLASRGADTGSDDSTYITWRNYAINQVCGLIGPIIAGGLVETKYLGREEPSLLAPQLPQRCNSAIPRSKLRCKM